jgi:hypothetical protein
MNRKESTLNAIQFELSPVKYDFSAGVEDDGARQPMTICDPIDALEWAVYARMPDGTAQWLHDAVSQSAAIDYIRNAGISKPIYLNTISGGLQPLTRQAGTPTFAVLHGTTGDNGVFKQVNGSAEVDRWALVVMRPTGTNSYTYVELGSHSTPTAAYFALSAVMNLGDAVVGRYVIARAKKVASTKNGRVTAESILWDKPDNDDLGVFVVDTNNETRCIFNSTSPVEIVEKLNQYNDTNLPIYLSCNGTERYVANQTWPLLVEHLNPLMA